MFSFSSVKYMLPVFFQSSSVSPSASFRAGEKHRSSSDYSSDSKKQKTDDKDLASTRYVSEDVTVGLS